MYPTKRVSLLVSPFPPPPTHQFTFFKKFEVLPQEMRDTSQLFPTSHYLGPESQDFFLFRVGKSDISMYADLN